MNITSQVAGIPCLIEVISYPQEPDYTDDVSDWNYFGFQWEFEVQDRNGRHAQWLEKKLTTVDQSRICRELDRALVEYAQ